MGLLEQEIKELRELNTLLIDKKVTASDVNARIAIYSQTEKRSKMILQAMVASAKYGKRATDAINRSNLTGDGSAIDTGTDLELEAILCPASGHTIARCECLDVSGSSTAFDECETCKHFSRTREKLLPA